MATFTFTGTVFNTPTWLAIPQQVFVVGQQIDIDLYAYLDDDFDGSITRKPDTDELQPDLSIVDRRYLRGSVAESFGVRTLQFTATREGVSVDSDPVKMGVESDASFETIPFQYIEYDNLWEFDVTPYVSDGFPEGWILSFETNNLIEGDISLTGNVISWTPVFADAGFVWRINFLLTHPTDSMVVVRSSVRVGVNLTDPDAVVWSSIPAHSGHYGSAFRINLNNFVTGRPTPRITLESGEYGSYTLSGGVFSGRRGYTSQTETFTFRATNVNGFVVSGTFELISLSRR